jgi:small subunit ribosomal protein S16
MIKIRLQRHGARHSPFYRMVVTPSTTRRDGKFIEVLGTYNPQAHLRSEELNLKMERIDHWLGVGAQPTDTARSLIRQSRLSPEQWLEKSEREASNRLKRAQKGNVAPAMEEAKLEEKSEESAPVKEEKTEAKAPAEADTKVEEKAPETKSEESASIKEKGKTEDKGSAKEEENLKEKPAADEKSKEVAGKDEPKAKKSEEDSKEA